MKRARHLRLVLLGGGVLLAAGGCEDRREACERARAINAPDVAERCRGSAGGGSSGAYVGRSAYSGTSGGWWSSRRGGFGGSASSFSAGG